MHAFICTQCGTQHAPSAAPPAACLTCEDDRQFVRWQGQAWTTAEELRQTHRVNRHEDEGVIGFTMEPSFAIGQRALLVEEPDGCTLWDCVSLVTPEVVDFIRSRGGLKAIAISHPHFYSGMVDWSRAFGGAPIYLHADDAEWIMRPDRAIVPWDGERRVLSPALTLIRCGGHFPGGSILHWKPAPDRPGILLVGDILSVTMDRAFVTFMYSFPNQIPLGPTAVEGIARSLEGLDFDRIYGTAQGRNILSGARGAVDRSVERYLGHIRA